ncbi:hypothetical protein FACS1894137_14080 [Spirochaetia bacterium]|nr:hypothetical protein FACS1894137_14080 [Spirochaetia bacterium]
MNCNQDCGSCDLGNALANGCRVAEDEYRRTHEPNCNGCNGDCVEQCGAPPQEVTE